MTNTILAIILILSLTTLIEVKLFGLLGLILCLITYAILWLLNSLFKLIYMRLAYELDYETKRLSLWFTGLMNKTMLVYNRIQDQLK